MITVDTFQKCLEIANGIKSKKSKKSIHKHLLIGNGFSRAFKNDIFDYNSLLEKADFKKLSPKIRAAFDELKTADFEMVTEALVRASALAKLYECKDTELSQKFESDAKELKNVLVDTIANTHPEQPGDIKEKQVKACKKFLVNFENYYSVNYDLLLYWVLLNDQVEPKIDFDDGFRRPEEGRQPWVTWNDTAHEQNLFYLHGALHIYEAASEIQKFTWINTQIHLIKQIREALDNNKYPLFVSGGTTLEKQAKIIRSSYLGRCSRSLQGIGGALFVHGLSLSDNDEHIIKAILNSKIEHLFVSIFGDQKSKENQKLMSYLEILPAKRSEHQNSLTIYFYDAESAKVWG